MHLMTMKLREISNSFTSYKFKAMKDVAELESKIE